MRSVSLFSSLLLISSTAVAGLGPIPGEDRFEGLTEEQPNSAGAELGFGAIDEDFFLKLTLRTGLNLGKVGIGLQVPLNLRVVDRDPKNEDDYYGLIRQEDWDEPAEYFKVIRYVRYGHKHSDDLIFARVGELAASIGHGTIMDRYLNNIDVDTFRVGTQLDVYTEYGGVETVVGDIGSLVLGSPDSKLVGGRLYVKPFGFVDPESPLNIFNVGVSLITDANAPRSIEETQATDDNGNPIYQNVDGQACTAGDPGCEPVMRNRVDEDGNLVVAAEGAATVWGLDLDVEVLNTDILKVTPYTDLNFIAGAGWGWHLGTLITLRMPVGLDLSIPVRLEYRRFRGDYVPAYFSTTYELERYTYPLGGDSIGPKNHVVREVLDDEGGLNGFYGDLAFDFAGLVQVGAIYEGYEGSRPNLAAFANVPALQIVQFKAYYTKTDVEDLNDLFALDNRSLLIAQGRYEVITFVYLVGRYTRTWKIEKETGKPKGVGDWQFGIEASFEF